MAEPTPGSSADAFRGAVEVAAAAAEAFGERGGVDKPWLTREAAVALVEAYGAAWAAQDLDTLSKLFTEDAVYCERFFSCERAVFEGRKEIHEYWRRQLARQRGVMFRQSRDELVLDRNRSRCLAKWEVRFEYLSSKGPWTPTRIMQVIIMRLMPPVEGGGGAMSSGAGVNGSAVNGGANGHSKNSRLPRIAGLEEYWHTENSDVIDGPRKSSLSVAALTQIAQKNAKNAAKGSNVCKEFVRGRCKWGVKCPSSHMKGEAGVAVALAKMLKEAPEEDVNITAMVDMLRNSPEGEHLDEASIDAYLDLMNEGESPFREGDWLCITCNAHNFAKKEICKRCQAHFSEGALWWTPEQSEGDLAGAGSSSSSTAKEQTDRSSGKATNASAFEKAPAKAVVPPKAAPAKSAAAAPADEPVSEGPWLPDSAIEAAAAGWRKQEEEQAAGANVSTEPDPEMQAALDMLAKAAEVVGIDADVVLGQEDGPPAKMARVGGPTIIMPPQKGAGPPSGGAKGCRKGTKGKRI